MKDRKGQITLYMIIGLLLLLVIAISVYFFRSNVDVEPTMEVLPATFTPVQEHIQECLRDTVIQGLKEISLHGGYLNPLDPEETRTVFTLNPLEPTNSDLVRLHPGDEESSIPYYWYLRSQNDCVNCQVTSLMPSIEHIANMTRSYVLEHLQECVNTAGLFPDIDITPSPEQKLAITIQPGHVLVHYEREYDMTKEATTVTAKTFYQDIPLDYKRYYDIARQVTQREIDTQFLENYLLYMITSYSGLEQPLPPIAAYDEGFAPKFWVNYNVGQSLKELLYTYTPALQVLDTKDVTPPPTVDDEYLAGFFNTVYLDLLNDSGLDASDVNVNIHYLGQPIYTSVNPRDGQLIKPRSEKSGGLLIIPARQQNYYNFFYDVSAPFIVELRVENALPGETLTYLFALEANLRENKNLVEWMTGHGTIPWSDSFTKVTVADPPILSHPNVSSTLNEVVYGHNESVHSIFCEEALETTPVTVRTFDGKTKKALPDVTFTYTCGLYDSCDVGYSKPDEYDVYAVYQGNVTPCLGGLLKAEKEGYNAVTTELSTRQGIPRRLHDLTLDPFETVTVNIEKYELTRDAVTEKEVLPANPAPLDTNESVVVTFTRTPLEEYDGPVTATATFTPDEVLNEVALVPGRYEVNAFFIDGDGVVIPKDCYKICKERKSFPLSGCKKYVYLPEEDEEIKPAPWGGLLLNDQTRYWQLERDELYSGKELVVPIFVAPPPRCYKDLEGMGAGETYARRWPSQATPHFE